MTLRDIAPRPSQEVNQGTGNVLTRDHSEAVLTAHPQPLPQVPVHLSSESAANSLQLTAIKEVPVLRDDTQDVSDSPFAALQVLSDVTCCNNLFTCDD